MAQIKINLEPSLNGNFSYEPGEILNGVAELHGEEPRKYSSFIIYISGRARTQIYNDDTLRKGNEEILNKIIYGFHHIQPVEIPIGVYRYKFCHLLPVNLPYSFQVQQYEKESSIEYVVKATLSGPCQLKMEVYIPFKIVNELDLNLHPSLRIGQSNEESLENCPLLCEKGKILFFASIPVSGYAIGEKIPVDIMYSNGSNNRILGTQIKLIQEIELRVFKSDNPDAKIEQTLVTKLFVLDNNQDKEISAKYFIDVPEGIYLSNDHICSLIKVKYRLEVKSKTTSWGVSSKLNFPITIGSKGIIGHVDSQFAPTAPSCSDIVSLNDAIVDQSQAPSAPTYMDIIMNSQQSSRCNLTDVSANRPGKPSTVVIHMDGSRDIIEEIAVHLNQRDDDEDVDDQPPSYEDAITKTHK